MALELHNPFFFTMRGAVIGVLLGAGVSLWTARRSAGTNALLDRLPLLLPAVDILGGTFQPWRGPVLLFGGLALTLWFTVGRGLSRQGGLALAILLPLAVYLPDISPYVGRADTFEFQVVAPRLGIAHPSGYPLYILIGKLFSLLPFGSPAWRVNLSSAMCAALASGVLFLALSAWENRRIENQEARSGDQGFSILDRRSTNLRLLLVALISSFLPTLWSRAIEAEVYALNALLTTMGLWLAVRWTTGELHPNRALPLFGLLTGVALASHITLGALAFLGLPLLLGRPRPTRRALLSAAGLGLAGLAIYAYIPLRWPAVNNGETMTLAHFLRFITNAESGGALRPLAFIQDPSRWSLVLRLLRMQVGWVGLMLAAVGLVRLFRKQRALAMGTLLAFAAWVWFNLSFYVADPDFSAFLIPAHVLVIFWLGIASSEWREARNKGREANHVLRFTLYASVLLLLLSRLWLTGPTLDTMSVGRSDEAWARYVLRQPLDNAAAILADSEKFPPLYYLQQVAGVRPDLELVMLFSEEQYRAALETRLAAGQRVYLARYLPGMDAYGVSAVGPLVEVHPPAHTVLSSTPAARFGNTLELNGFHLERDPEGRPLHHLTLMWRALAAIGDDLEVRVRLTYAGQTVWQNVATRPVGGYTTTQAWQAGTVVADYYALPWPQWLSAGNYDVELAVFPRFGQSGLPVDGTATVWHPLGSIAIPASDQQPLSRHANALFVTLRLAGADFPGEARADGAFDLDLAWQRNRTAPQATPEIRWLREGRVVQATLLQGLGPATAPDAWSPGKTRTIRYPVVAPPEPGRYHLELGLRAAGQTMLPAHCDWLAARSDYCLLGEINVRPSQVGLANFADQIALLNATLDAGAIPAGGQVRVDLRWRGLRALEHDYTVFVQAIGPDGQVYGQADSWPIQGTRPTSSWAVGEELADPYQFYLKPNAPTGQYRVIVGWYLLADMSRLPVLDAEGHVIGDFYEVGGGFTKP